MRDLWTQVHEMLTTPLPDRFSKSTHSIPAFQDLVFGVSARERTGTNIEQKSENVGGTVYKDLSGKLVFGEVDGFEQSIAMGVGRGGYMCPQAPKRWAPK